MLEPDWGTTEPPGARPVKGNPAVKLIVVALVIVALIAIAFFVPLPVFYAYLPGPVRDVEKLVDVGSAQSFSSEGSLLLTTVSVDPQVTFSEMIASGFDDARAVVLKEDVTGGRSLDDLIEQQKVEMEASKRAAQEVALAALGLAEPTGDGARIIRTIPRYPAAGVLERGDVIVSVEREPVQTTCEVGRAIDSHEVGEPVDVAVERDGRRRAFSFETAEDPRNPGSAIIGVFMEDVNRQFDPGIEVSFDTGKIGGPSGGLMMTLALYDQLTPDDITGGKKVAGTGTIACDGGVGPIGGVEQKVAGAENAGAEIFLAPAGNAAAAREVADEIEVVSIRNFDQALAYLEDLPSG